MAQSMIPVLQIPNTQPSLKVGYVRGKGHIRFKVLTASVTVRVGASREFLDQGVPFVGAPNGEQYTSLDGSVSLPWEGDIFMGGVVGNGSIPLVQLTITDF